MSVDIERGYIHIYTGDGKGKTTAALGLAIRAVCAGKKVFFGQFCKRCHTSKLTAAAQFTNLTIKQYGTGEFICHAPGSKDIIAATASWREILDIIHTGNYNIVILDELISALNYRLLNITEIIETLKNKPMSVEIIITGRAAPRELIDIADLVTEMQMIKHYYNIGVPARCGIEY